MNILDRFSKNTQILNFIEIRLVGAKLFHADSPTDRQTGAKLFHADSPTDRQTGAKLFHADSPTDRQTLRS